jgi:hypothetical protein
MRKTPIFRYGAWLTALAQEGAKMRILRKWAFVAFLTLLTVTLGPTGFAQSAPPGPAISPDDLVRAVVANELKPQDHPGRWMYQVDKEEDGKKQTKEVVQMREGSMERLTAVDGHSLSSKKQREEAVRIEKLVGHAPERQKLEEVQRKEAAQCEALFKMIPDAFLFSYEGHEGEWVKLGFKPNPTFQPSSREARVLHAMEGEILVQAKQRKLAAISGHLMEDVKFGGGLLGHLEKGGTFSVKRTEIAPAQWVLTGMEVDMRGKALFLKTIAVQQKEYRSNFRKLADDLTLTEAANIVNGRVTLAANH